MKMVLPNFIGIGVQRAATTWLYNCLSEHPQVFMPPEKEIHYFDIHFEKGVDWYASHFSGNTGEIAIGEITPNYFHADGGIERMARFNPRAKLIIIFREPCERTYSAYKLLHEQFAGKSFRQACSESKYLTRLSCYADKLEELYSFYPVENIKIFLYDDVKNSPYKLIKDIYSFLNVDQEYMPLAIERIYNKIIFPNTQWLVRKFGLSFFLEYVKKTKFSDFIRDKYEYKKIKSTRSKDESIFRMGMINRQSNDDLEYLNELKSFFREDVLKLQTLINRDLSSWLV